jgi:peptide/nickel transport system substrate-binding protein
VAVADLRRLAAVVAALLACACGSVSSNIAPGSSHPKILRIVGAQEIDTLPPLLSNEQFAVDCSMFWAGYFFNVDDKGNLVPELATVEPTLENGGISKDGLTIMYHLRRGVTWQDGAPFDARDVRFTWQAIMNPDNNVASRTGYDRVRDVQIVDDHTVRFLLKERYAPAVDTFFAPSAGPIALLPAHLLAKYPNLNHAPYDVKPVGTGPFIVDEWEQGVGVTMHANPHYWRGRPKLDGIRFLTVHDNNTMLVMMRTGEADLYYRIPDGQIPQLGAIGGTHKLVTPFVGYEMLIFNTSRPPLDDVAVRQAISYAVDKRRIVADVTHESGTPTTSDQPPWLWAYNAAVPQFDANPNKARGMLTAGGWLPGADGVRVKSGRRLAISISTPAGFRDGLQFEGLFQQWMRDVGVDVEIKNYPSNLLYATFGGGGILAVGKYDAAFVDWYNGIDPDDSVQWECHYVPPAGQNFARWCDSQYDAAEAIALTTYDRAARKRAYGDAQLRLAKGMPADFLYFIGRTDLASDRLTGYRPAPAVSTFWNTWEYDLK